MANAVVTKLCIPVKVTSSLDQSNIVQLPRILQVVAVDSLSLGYRDVVRVMYLGMFTLATFRRTDGRASNVYN